MKPCDSKVRLALLPLACAAIFSPPVHAQSGASLPVTVVSASRFAEPADSLPLGVSVITADDLRASGATTVNEAIMKLLGVPGRQDAYGGGEYGIDLRGFGSTADSNQVVILDGIRLNEGDMGGTRLSGIPIDAIERIEVLRGSGSVLYGEGATGGAIVITTKAGHGGQRSSGASAYAAVGSNSLRELRANATVSGGGFTLDAGGYRRSGDNHRENFRSESDGASLSLQWASDKLRLGARHSRDALDTRLPGSLTAAQYAADPSRSFTPNDWARIRNESSGVFAETFLGDWQLALDLGWRDKELATRTYGYDVTAYQQSLRARNESRWGSVRNTLVLGHDHGTWERTDIFADTATQSSSAWYLKDDVVLASGTRLSAGVRSGTVDKKHTTAGNLGGRRNAWELGVSQPLSAATTAWARAGSSFRFANADEYSWTDPAVALRPQTSRDLEAGLRWASGDFTTETRAYRSLLTDEIAYDPTAPAPFGLTGSNINLDPTRRQGVELDGQWRVSSTLRLSLNLALREATFRSGPNVGKDVPLVPREVLALRADWTPAAGHRVTAGLNWVGSQHPDFANQCRMPSYTTVDARYAYQWRQMELSFGVKNLFDRDYYTQAFSCVGASPSGIYPEAGRTFTAAMRVAF